MPAHDLSAQVPAGVDISEIQALVDRGFTPGEISNSLGGGVEPKQISRLVARLQGRSGLLEKYRQAQVDQLTELQFRLLSGITDDKISDAPLRDIVGAFKVLKDKELVAQGKPTEIHGLVGYLDALDREERGEAIDVTPAVSSAQPSHGTAEEDLPNL